MTGIAEISTLAPARSRSTLGTSTSAFVIVAVAVSSLFTLALGRADARQVEVWSNRTHVVTGGELPPLARPVVAIANAPAVDGYWLAAADGGVFSHGAVGFHGSAGGLALDSDVVGIAATGDGRGYWLVTAEGAVLSFGAAGFHGSVKGIPLAAPVEAIIPAVDDRGYWLVAADGGVFAFGSAPYLGSGADGQGSAPTVDLVRTRTGSGYWLVDQLGGTRTFGDAPQLAAIPSRRGLVAGAAPSGAGLVVAWDSGVVDVLTSWGVDRTALVSMSRVVDVSEAAGTRVVAATGDPVRRLGPSVGNGGEASVARFAASSGSQVGLVSFYSNFHDEPDLPIRWLDLVHDMGAIPFVSWEPWNPAGDIQVQWDYQLHDIIEGRHDALIWRWATQAASYDKPFMIRFAHEMNGDWYPWGASVNGNNPGEYIAAWQHVWRIFEQAGAHNVTWVWNPNVETPTSTPLAQLYPGDAFVDLVAIDGYNAGSALPWGGWRPASSILGRALDELRAAAPGKPVIIGETASTESGGSKAQWTQEFFEWLERDHPDISMVVWFEEAKETTWWVGSSSASASAFAEHAADRWCGCRQ